MCEYCGCREISVIGDYTEEHIDIVNHLTALRAAVESGGPEQLAAAVRGMAGALDPHTLREEAGLFTVLREEEEFLTHVEALCAEHVTLAGLLAQIAAGEHDVFHHFEDLLRDHILKEENGIFPAAAVTLTGDQWDRVVDGMAAVQVQAAALAAGDGGYSSGTIEIEPHGHSATQIPQPLQ